jgi:CMP-N,N'-diacetyllegionaminic acid synthase
MNTIATICARGGSQGVPGKNIRPLAGKPLIVHTIEQARACRAIDKVYVSTDDARIADVASQAGAEVPFLRPAELATADAPRCSHRRPTSLSPRTRRRRTRTSIWWSTTRRAGCGW